MSTKPFLAGLFLLLVVAEVFWYPAQSIKLSEEDPLLSGDARSRKAKALRATPASASSTSGRRRTRTSLSSNRRGQNLPN